MSMRVIIASRKGKPRSVLNLSIALLNHYEERKDVILRKFAENRIDWTLNQFEEEFLGVSKRGKVYDYFLKQIDILKATNHIGNAKAYERTLIP